MIPIITSEQMRSIDERTITGMSFPSLILMERAGIGVARFVSDLLSDVEDYGALNITILCGRGNNGGDGFVVARNLAEDGYLVRVGVLADEDELSTDAKVNLNLCRLYNALNIDFIRNESELSEVIAGSTLVVDALLGTGAKPGLRKLYKKASDIIKDIPLVVALDVPSGLDASNGDWGESAVEADYTITLALPKIGLISPNASELVGEVFIHRLGYPESAIEDENPDIFLLENEDFMDLLPVRDMHAHKGDFGRVLIIAGSRGMVGAAVMTAQSALRAGAGLVKLVIPESLEPQARSQLVEVMTIPVSEEDGAFGRDAFVELKEHLEWADTVAFGPGVSTNESVRILLQDLIRAEIPMLIDADGLNLLSETDIGKLPEGSVITPHPGELARLLSTTIEDIQNDRIGYTKKAIERYGCAVVLKGAVSVIGTVDESTYISPTGGPELASGGTGDVLAGLIVGFDAQNDNAFVSALLGTYIHGLCGDILSLEVDERYVSATDLLDVLPSAFEILKNPPTYPSEHLLDPFPEPLWGRIARQYRVEGEWDYFA